MKSIVLQTLFATVLALSSVSAFPASTDSDVSNTDDNQSAPQENQENLAPTAPEGSQEDGASEDSGDKMQRPVVQGPSAEEMEERRRRLAEARARISAAREGMQDRYGYGPAAGRPMDVGRDVDRDVDRDTIRINKLEMADKVNVLNFPERVGSRVNRFDRLDRFDRFGRFDRLDRFDACGPRLRGSRLGWADGVDCVRGPGYGAGIGAGYGAGVGAGYMAGYGAGVGSAPGWLDGNRLC